MPADAICGVISISGAGLDLGDEETYRIGADYAYYEKRFAVGSTDDAWKREASPVTYIDANDPPFLILYAGGEGRALQHQAHVLAGRLTDAGVPNEVVVVPGENHSRIVLTLSRDDKTAGPAILRFIRQADCGV